MNQPTYSIVIPIYNEQENIQEMYHRLSLVMEDLKVGYELILIDDGSRDRSLSLIREIHSQDSCVKYISLARNFGHQIAVTAGLNHAQGQAVIVIDADLQDPPELILQMGEKWQQGYEVVYAKRIARKREGFLKKAFAYVFYRVLRRLADVDIPSDTGDFCLMDRRVVDILNAMPERNRYIRGLRAWVGFNQTSVLFERDPRYAGKEKYTFGKSWSLAINGIVSLSRIPLRLATYLGMISAGMAMLMILTVIYWRFFNMASSLIGYTLITIALLFLGSVQLLCLGILGEYIGRIYEEIKGRPMYTIKEIGGIVSATNPANPKTTSIYLP